MQKGFQQAQLLLQLKIGLLRLDLLLYGLASSKLTAAGEKLGLLTVHEVFADRTYQADGTLTSRTMLNATLLMNQKRLHKLSKW